MSHRPARGRHAAVFRARAFSRAAQPLAYPESGCRQTSVLQARGFCSSLWLSHRAQYKQLRVPDKLTLHGEISSVLTAYPIRIVILSERWSRAQSKGSEPKDLSELGDRLPSILRMFFHLPYTVSPLFVTLAKTAGVYPVSSHSGTEHQTRNFVPLAPTRCRDAGATKCGHARTRWACLRQTSYRATRLRRWGNCVQAWQRGCFCKSHRCRPEGGATPGRRSARAGAAD